MFLDYPVTHVPGLYRHPANVRCSRRTILKICECFAFAFYLTRLQLIFGVRPQHTPR